MSFLSHFKKLLNAIFSLLGRRSTKAAEIAQIISLPIAIVSLLLSMDANAPSAPSKNLSNTDARIHPEIGSDAKNVAKEVIEKGAVRVSRVVIDKNLSFYRKHIRGELLSSEERSEFDEDTVWAFESFDPEVFFSYSSAQWVPSEKWIERYKCGISNSYRALNSICQKAFLIDPVFDIILESDGADVATVLATRLYVRSYGEQAGDGPERIAADSAAIPYSASYEIDVPSNYSEYAIMPAFYGEYGSSEYNSRNKWVYSELDMQPPLLVGRNKPARFSLKIRDDDRVAPVTLLVHLEFVLGDGRKIRSKPFSIFFV